MADLSSQPLEERDEEEAMQEEDEEDDDTGAAMAQALGFASFGTQRPHGRPAKKKRKYLDAVSEPATGPNAAAITPAARRPHHHIYPNTTPQAAQLSLAVPGTTASATAGSAPLMGNTDEIDLDDSDSDARGAPLTGRSPPSLSSLDRVSGVGVVVPPSGSAAQHVHGTGLPARPQYASFSSSSVGPGHVAPSMPRGGRGGGARGGAGRGQGGPRTGGPWWEGYYDPRFNANPWEKEERAMGLQPKGSWVPRDRHGG
jgi:hypothetical protein